MKVIAVEEHYDTAAIRDANEGHPLRAQQKNRPGPLAEFDPGRKLGDLGAERIAEMDAGGIDVQVLSYTPPGPESLEPALSVSLATEANDILAAAVRAHPDRFAGFATLPTPDPEAAAEELERAVGELGFVGALVNGMTDGRFMDDPFFWPIFERAEALEVPIYLHPNLAPQAVIDAYYKGFSPLVDQLLLTGGWAWHIETGLHSLRLILGGVFDRYPNLQIVIGHMGEALPFQIWRSDWTLTPVSGLQRPVKEYFSSNFYVSTSGVFDPVAFEAALHTLGTDRILFAVDYPYASNELGVAFLESLSISAEDREKIAHGNAERLLKL